MRSKPKLTEIIMTDYITFFSVFTIIIGGGIGLYLVIGEVKDYWGYVFAGLAFLSLIRAIVRIIFIHKMFSIGTEIDAEVIKVFFYRSRASIKFDYTFESVKFSRSNFLLRNSKSNKLPVGTKIKILVDPSKPTNVLILDVYKTITSNL
ncbi:MAG: hypothetical protein KKE16_01000 [Firmicutes bacterium]|nr:hypothetical protein [Bacillota bacterium]